MPLAKSLPCADLGTAYCPCSLAFVGACVYCTRLRMAESCDCDWAGACALLQAGAKGLAPGKAMPGLRRSRTSHVLAARAVAPGVREIRFAVDPGATVAFRRPGAFLLVRAAGRPAYFDLPLTVPYSDPGELRLIFKVAGPKTRALEAAIHGDLVVWRGPYYSGLHGGYRLTWQRPDYAVIVTRGLGQVMGLQAASWLRSRDVPATVLVDPRGAGGRFALEELSKAGATGSIECRDPGGVLAVEGVLRGLAGSGAVRRPGPEPARAGCAPGGHGRVVLISCGTDLQHRWLAQSWSRLRVAAAPLTVEMVATNNSLVVCGEGVCGACVRRLSRGERFRGCKADPPAELIWPPPHAQASLPASPAFRGRSGNG